jgi:uncharacterized protein YgiM (DUF1202 family)
MLTRNGAMITQNLDMFVKKTVILKRSGSVFVLLAGIVGLFLCTNLAIAAEAMDAGSAAAAVQVFPYAAEVTADGINLRSDSTTSSDVICTLQKGAIVEAVGEIYGWNKVRLPETAPAYLRADLAVSVEERTANFVPQDAANSRFNAIKITPERVNIRLRPDESSPIIGHAVKNEVVKFTELREKWYRIVPPRNVFGWIHSNFLRKVEPPVETAGSLLPAGITLPAGEPVAAASNKISESGVTESEKAKPQTGLSVYEGIVKAYGMVFNRRATHKLITKDKNVFLLKGDKQSLNAVVNRRVRITGKENGIAGKKYNLIEIVKIEVLD